LPVVQREDQGRLDIGILPAFAGAFIHEAANLPNVHALFDRSALGGA